MFITFKQHSGFCALCSMSIEAVIQDEEGVKLITDRGVEYLLDEEFDTVVHKLNSGFTLSHH